MLHNSHQSYRSIYFFPFPSLPHCHSSSVQPGSASSSDVLPTLFPRWDSGCSCVGRGLPIQRGWGKRAQYGQKHCAKGIEMTKKRQGSVADGLCSQGRHTFPQSQLGLKHLHRGWPGHTIQSKMGNISTGHLLTWPLEAPERWQISLLY